MAMSSASEHIRQRTHQRRGEELHALAWEYETEGFEISKVAMNREGVRKKKEKRKNLRLFSTVLG
jgi:hypothetical protein